MCIDCDEGVTRRAFLSGATVAAVGIALGSEARGQKQSGDAAKALHDPQIIQEAVTFKNGAETIKGYLARPKAAGRRRAHFIIHGNPGIPEDIRNTAAQVAQAGYVGLALDWNSRVAGDDTKKLEHPVEFYRSNTFARQETGDILAGIDYLKAHPFVIPGGVGLVGFCGGGRICLVLATQSRDVIGVISFYGPVLYGRFKHATDPPPDVMDVVKEIRVPVQGHYGLDDPVAPAADARLFEQALRAQKTPVEMFYYEGAGHAFYDYTRLASEQRGKGFGYNEAAARLAHSRMLKFLKRFK